MKMDDFSAIEKYVSVKIIQSDAEAILSLMKSEHDSVFAMGIMPYYALFVQSCQEYMGQSFLPESEALRIKDIRNYIKALSDSFGRSKKRIFEIDAEQDNKYKSMLRFEFLKKLNAHLNLGSYWTENQHIIGNTQQIADCLGVPSLSSPDIGKKQFELARQIGSFVASICEGLNGPLGEINIGREEQSIKIKYYYDINTNKKNALFSKNNPKELNLFYLNILCNMNFVKLILKPLFSKGNTWIFRVEYIVTYYSFRALERLKNYCENNREVNIDLQEITELQREAKGLFQSKFRNCMMHYDLVGWDVLSPENLDKPFGGMVETCFEGMSYFDYSAKLDHFSNKVIDYLEEQFEYKNIDLQLL